LLYLRDKIVAFEFGAVVPPDLAGDEDLSALSSDAVRIAFGGNPIVGVQKFKINCAHASPFTIAVAV
jgi:hypothetical protein